jgi:hypothetical protein
MSELEDLPADQRSVLQLLLRRGRSYSELAELLKIERDAVRARAYASVDALGLGAGAGLAPEQRAEIADYLLGQQEAPRRGATRQQLADSSTARDWARAVATALAPIARDGLPEIPDGKPPRRSRRVAEPAAVATSSEPLAPSSANASFGEPRRSSRLGGAVLLGTIAVIVVVLIVVLTSGGGASKSPTKTTAATTTTPASSTATQPALTPLHQTNLKATTDGGAASGYVQVAADPAGKLVLLIVAAKLAPNDKNLYAVWVTHGPNGAAKRIGFAPPVTTQGTLAVQASIPASTSGYHEIVITRETVANPPQPGTVILHGANFKLR